MGISDDTTDRFADEPGCANYANYAGYANDANDANYAIDADRAGGARRAKHEVGALSDFHTHSTFSDGSTTPSELVGRAVKNGVGYLSLTDHDSMDGTDEAERAAAAAGVVFIPGVELSASYGCEIHLLGYFNRGGYGGFVSFLDGIQKERRERNAAVLAKLASLGVNISEADIKRAAEDGKNRGKKNGFVGRPHIATALINMGAARDMEHAFKQYLGKNGAAYVKRRTPDPFECVKAITAAGGVASLAHPVHIDLKLSDLRVFARELKKAGLKGVEAYYPDNTPAETANFIELADELGLIKTGGSDFHGAFRPGVEPGSGRSQNLRVPTESALNLIALIGN